MSVRQAFTLIELLVVIAIISIIAAILFPVFAQVREKARQTACSSNEKQLSLGVLMYAQDSDEVLPPTQNDANVLWPDLVNPYVKNDKIRVCPSDQGGVTNSYALDQMTFVDMTDFLPNPPPSMPALAAFQTPADTVMLGETGTGDDFKTPRLNAYKLIAPDDDINDAADARPSARHFQRADLAFMDGHVKSLRLEQFYIGQTPPDKFFCTDPDNAASCKTGP
jgi:prepilin-type N-terminal cleavage/methylation domain-containing protein